MKAVSNLTTSFDSKFVTSPEDALIDDTYDNRKIL